MCEKYFTQKSYLKTHVIIVHDKMKTKCEPCNKYFSRINSHNKTVHKGVKSYKCTSCEKEFSRKFCLKLHTNAVRNQIKAYKCDMCAKTFTQQGGLRRHIDMIHEKQKGFECDICGMINLDQCKTIVGIDT